MNTADQVSAQAGTRRALRAAEASERSRRGGRRPRRRARRIALVVGTVAALLGLGAAVGYPAYLALTFDTQTQDIPDAFPQDRLRPPVLEGEAAAARNILLLGSDSRAGIGADIDDIEGTRSDSIMLVHIPADRSSIQVMSIMRDSYVTIPGFGQNKINSALAQGGIALTVQTIEDLVGVRIDRVAIIDFEGFAGMTEAIGGVTIDNPRSFSTTAAAPIFFPAGPITLSGQEALEYVRERRAFAVADYQRVRNQQAFIKGFMAKVLNAETLTNPARIAGLVQAVSPFLSVDSGFDSAFVASIAFELRDVRLNDVSLFTMPTTGTGTVGGQSVVFVDEEQLAIIREALQADELAGYEPPPSVL